MPLRKYERVLLELLEGQERTIARIYAGYARSFPQHETFWLRLSGDESNHAKWVATLGQAVERGKVEIDPAQLRLEELGKFAKYLKERLEEAEAGALTAPRSFHHAARIESGLLEEPFQRVFVSSDPKATRLLEKLVEQTRRHAGLVAEMVKQIGPENRPDGIKPRK